ncbi:hypothetical protein AZE42_00198, partial [Rhizopogon vesiculosus]
MSLIKQDNIGLGNLLATDINLFDGEVDIKAPNVTRVMITKFLSQFLTF